MREFDRKRCIGNIIREAKEQGKKIGETEDKAGVSPGFLSRINNDDEKGNFDVKVFSSISEQLGCTMDYLAYYDEATDMTDNDRYMLKFLDQLSFDTIRYNTEWEMMDPNIVSDEYVFDHPLFSVKEGLDEHPVTGEFKERTTCIYNSRYDNDVKISGHCYQADLDQFGKDRVCVMSVSYYEEADNSFSSGYKSGYLEFYLIDSYENVTTLASSYYVCDQLRKAMENLYQNIEAARSHLTLSNKATRVISRYMRSSKEANESREEGDSSDGDK